jgi:organic radical activating enzyme
MATKQEVIERAVALGIIARKSEWAGIPVKSAEWEACLAKLATRETALSGSVEDTMRAVEEVLHEPGMDDVLAEWNEEGQRDAAEAAEIQSVMTGKPVTREPSASEKWRERPADQRFATRDEADEAVLAARRDAETRAEIVRRLQEPMPENVMAWPKQDEPQQPMYLNRAARRRMAKLNSTRAQRLASRA